MYFEFLRAALAVFFITAVGGCIAVWLNRARTWIELFCYGWAFGLACLYGIGMAVLRFKALAPHLPLFVAIPGCFFFYLCVRDRKKLPRLLTRWKGSIDLITGLMIGAILLKVSLLFFVVLNFPVFDSDATNADRWVGLAKNIYREGWYLADSAHYERFSPSLIPLWMSYFTSRWFDSFAALPGFISWLGILGLSGNYFLEKTGTLRGALFFPFVLALLPLLSTHVIRPGYADLPVCFFFLGIVIETLGLMESKSTEQAKVLRWLPYFGFSFCLILTKKEGAAWLAWSLWVLGMEALMDRSRFSARDFVRVELFFLGVFFAVYYFTSDFIAEHLIQDYRMKWLFEHVYSSDAIYAFFYHLFILNSFGLYWWLTIASVFYFMKFAKESRQQFLATQIAVLLGAVFYFHCFTGNVPKTINWTNQGRFFLQLIPLGVMVLELFLPYLNDPNLLGSFKVSGSNKH